MGGLRETLGLRRVVPLEGFAGSVLVDVSSSQQVGGFSTFHSQIACFSLKKKKQFTALSALRLCCSHLQAFLVHPQRLELFFLCTTVRFINDAGFDLPAGENQEGVASLPQLCLTSAAQALSPRQEYISGYPIPDKN